MDSHLAEDNPRAVLGMFQSWLFIDFLEAILETRVRSADFLEVKPFAGNGFILSTRSLLDYFDPMAKHLAGLDNDEYEAYFERISPIRANANRYRNILSNTDQFEVFAPLSYLGEFGGVMLQLSVLDESILYLWMASATYAKRKRNAQWMNLPRSTPLISLQEMRTRAQSQGWCPSVIDELSLLGMDMVQYLTTMASSDSPRKTPHTNMQTARHTFVWGTM